MTSEIKVDTISEQTSANGVTIDGLTIKDGNIIGDVALAGTTPTFTIGDGGAEDAALIFDGNAVDFVVGLDDSADEFRIGVGSGLGSDRVFEINSSGVSTFQKAVHFAGSTPTVTVGDGGAEDAKILFDGNAQNFHIGLDDSEDKLTIGLGNNLGTFPAITIDENNKVTLPDGQMEIAITGNYDNLILTSTDADASIGPNLRLYRNSSSPADNDDLGTIDFEGRNDNSQDVQYGMIRAILKDASDGTEDGTLEFHHMKNGSLAPSLQITPDECVINESSNDYDFRVESNGNTHMLFVDGGNNAVGIGTSSPTAQLTVADDFHIVGATPTITLTDTDDNSDCMVYQGAGNLYLEADKNSEASGSFLRIAVDDLDFVHVYNGSTVFNESSRDQDFRVESNDNTHTFFIDAGVTRTFINESADTLNDNGLTINQGAGDNTILALKSSDIAHGRTSVAETDTYAEFHKAGINDGGLQITTLNDLGNIAFYLDAHARSVDTGKGTGDHGIMNFDANTHDGSNSGTSLTSNGNMVTFSNDNSVRFIFDAEGDIHVDGSSSISTYDAYEDAQLIRAYDLSHGAGVIASQFDKFVQYNKDDLTDAGLVGRVNHETLKDGTEAKPLINMTGFVRLHNGAIWQQYEKHQRLAEAVYEMAKEALGEDKADAILEKHDIKLLN